MATSDFRDVEVICPYYKQTKKHAIRCEGTEGVSSLEMHFDTNDERDTYREKYCDCFEYMNCPIAKLVTLKYEK